MKPKPVKDDEGDLGYSTLIIPTSEGGLVVGVGNKWKKISFYYDISATKRSRKHCSSRECSLKILLDLTLFIDKHVFAYYYFIALQVP